MDAAQNMRDKRCINELVTKFKWASEIMNEEGTHIDQYKTKDAPPAWRKTVEEIFKQQNIKLGRWYHDGSALAKHKERLKEHKHAVDTEGKIWKITNRC